MKKLVLIVTTCVPLVSSLLATAQETEPKIKVIAGPTTMFLNVPPAEKGAFAVHMNSSKIESNKDSIALKENASIQLGLGNQIVKLQASHIKVLQKYGRITHMTLEGKGRVEMQLDGKTVSELTSENMEIEFPPASRLPTNWKRNEGPEPLG